LVILRNVGNGEELAVAGILRIHTAMAIDLSGAAPIMPQKKALLHNPVSN
jgi:hypothetical protein